MNKNIITAVLATAIIIGGGAFYGGMKYGASANASMKTANGGDMQARMGQGMRGGNRGGGFISGAIIAQDDKSITVKMRDGGSKIIFLSATTQVMKTTDGAASDLVIGKEVTAMGTANSDGSITAQSVQIRPAMMQMATPQVSPSSGDGKTTATTASGVKEFTVTGTSFSFAPSSMTVKKGDKVKITFVNASGFHDFRLDEFKVATPKINGGEQAVVEFTADKIGTFEYYCSVGEHRAMGMKGTLTVTE